MKKNLSIWAAFHRLWRDWFIVYKKKLIVAMLLMVLVALTAASYPVAISKVFEDIEGETHILFWTLPLVIIALAFIKSIAMYFQAKQINEIALLVTLALQKAMAAKAITADLAVIHASPSGEFVSRLINDVKLVREAIVRITNSIIRDLLTIIVMVTMMFWFDWVLALTVMVIYPLAIVPVAVIGRRQNEQSRYLQEDLGRALSVLSETIQASRIVRAYRLEEHEVARTSAVFESLLGRTLKMMLGKMKVDPILECLGGIAIALAISISVWRLSTGALEASDIAGFVTAFLVLVNPARSLGTLNAVAQQALAALERIFTFLDREPTIVSPQSPVPILPIKGHISFEGVGFAYEDKQILHDINFEAKPDQIVAIVGPSGSGKTTLLNLLPRFFDVGTGRITIDGHGVDSISLDDLRSSIALVSQDSVLFNTTIMDNIRLGRLDASDAEVKQAATAADADRFIADQPQGYETIVGEGGNRLSLGQRQRIAIARAFLRNAPILLLDEVTSALDAQSEENLKQILTKLAKGRVTLMVSHRLTTVQNADMILVVQQGRVIETGTHSELIKKNGLYKRLSTLQQLD